MTAIGVNKNGWLSYFFIVDSSAENLDKLSTILINLDFVVHAGR